MKAFAMNILLALCWLFLSTDQSVTDFVLGYLLGFGLMYLFRALPYCGEYVRRSIALIRFIMVFLREYMKANLQMAWMVLLRSNKRIKSGMIDYSIEGLAPIEILILSHVISLTPGSTTVEVSPDFRVMLLHLFDASNPDETRTEIDLRLRNGIIAFMRGGDDPVREFEENPTSRTSGILPWKEN